MSAITGIRLATELRDSMCRDCKPSHSGASCCQPSRREALERFDAERARAAYGIGAPQPSEPPDPLEALRRHGNAAGNMWAALDGYGTGAPHD
jgi:hypothetical protein